jgi:serine/threonine protein kinase
VKTERCHANNFCFLALHVCTGLWPSTSPFFILLPHSQRVAIKVLTHLTPKALEEFEKEAAVMQNLKPHDNVVELLGVCSEPVALITEFVDFGCLKEWRKQTGANASEEELMQITRGVANGVLYLHNEGIIHRE